MGRPQSTEHVAQVALEVVGRHLTVVSLDGKVEHVRLGKLESGMGSTHSEVVVAVVGHDGDDLILIPEGSDDLRDIWAASTSSESSENRQEGPCQPFARGRAKFDGRGRTSSLRGWRSRSRFEQDLT